jgi:hypothetical protein
MSPLFNDKIIVGMGCENNNNNKWRFELNDWQLIEISFSEFSICETKYIIQ